MTTRVEITHTVVGTDKDGDETLWVGDGERFWQVDNDIQVRAGDHIAFVPPRLPNARARRGRVGRGRVSTMAEALATGVGLFVSASGSA